MAMDVTYCGDFPFSARETISSLTVLDSKQYDANHFAGDTLNDIIDLPSDNGLGFITLADFIDTEPSARVIFTFSFNTPPAMADTHVFVVNYIQTNGEHYSMTSDPIKLLP
ncbi:hypothetical protein JNM05_04725 [bacterium]|nr:hypothetical protein [bacterium]MBL7994657.1 hypothetical protein [bacterium]